MILVVVVTVLMAVVGVMFVMVARVGEMETSAVIDNSDLDAAVRSVVNRIHAVLVEDLFGDDGRIGSNGPHYTWPGLSGGSRVNPWLSSLEPRSIDTNLVDGLYQWEYLTDFSGGSVVSQWDSILRNGEATLVLPEFGGIIQGYQRFTQTVAGRETPMTIAEINGLPADASGDGVADSLWMAVPNLMTSRGRPVWAAVRIIDNCAMLNLNTAYCFYQTPYNAASPQSAFDKLWYLSQTAHGSGLAYMGTAFSSNAPYGDGGRYLTEINYLPFLRGSDLNSILGGVGDGWYNIAIAKKFSWLNAQVFSVTPEQAHEAVMSIENATEHPSLPSAYYTFFDIGDELEMRYRYLMTSRVAARFERSDVANFSYDAGGNKYAALTVPRENKLEDGIPHFARWKWRVDPRNFDHLSGAFNDNWGGTPLDLRFRYDRRHISTFYSFDRPLRTGAYPHLETDLALEGDAARRQAREALFRPQYNRPVDLRELTNPANSDRITANTDDARRNILHLLYAFRAAYLPTDFASMTNENQRRQALNQAARKSAQLVANLIDFLDANNTPTVIDRAYVRQLIRDVSASDAAVGGEIDIGASAPAIPQLLGRYEFGLGIIDEAEVVYGYERQPFISEIYCHYVPSAGGSKAFAVELINPYEQPFSLANWQLRLGSTSYSLSSAPNIPAASGTTLGRLTIWAADTGYTVTRIGADHYIAGFGLGDLMGRALHLERVDPANAAEFLTVDIVGASVLFDLVGDNVMHSIKRDDTQWRFTNAGEYRAVRIFSSAQATLGSPNNLPIDSAKGFQLPVANDSEPFARLADFIKLTFIGNQKGGTSPLTITQQIGLAADESAVRHDIMASPRLLDYICFLDRPEGSLPGRININTAAKHVIAAAIPPQLVMATTDDPQNALYFAEQIIANRPYRRIGDLLTKVPAFRKFASTTTPNVGDPRIAGDFEERDWILARLANIFTVRSDTFTAYILVRLGHDGPERRMMAIFDRSDCRTPDDRPRLVALHPVADAR